MKKRYAGLALGLTGLLMLGCSGLVGEQAPSLPDEAPADLRVASTTLSKGSKTHPGPSDRTREETHKKGEYVIKLRPGAGLPKFLKGKTVQTSDKGINSSLKQLDLSEAANVHGFSPKNAELASLLGLERTIRIKTKRPAAQVLRLERHPDIEWVEPVVKMHSAGQPNDPYFAYQWHMKMLDVTTAWETTQGEGVVVAVVDSGVSEGQDGYHKLLEGREVS